MDNEQHIIMCKRIPSNQAWHEKISSSCIAQKPTEFCKIINQACLCDKIGQETCEYIRVQNSKTTTFYELPKTHKYLKSPPGRPIVSEINSLTERASRLVNSHLRPHVMSLLSHI